MESKIIELFEEEFMPMTAEKDKQWFGVFKAGYQAAPSAVPANHIGDGNEMVQDRIAEVGETMQSQAQQPAQEPVAWKAITLGYRKFVTQSEYEKFSLSAQCWYEPFSCDSCKTQKPVSSNELMKQDKKLGGDFAQPNWGHLGQAFIDGAIEAKMNPDADKELFLRAADGYTKRLFEELDPLSEALLRNNDYPTIEQEVQDPPAPSMSQFASKADYEAAIKSQPAQEPVKQEPYAYDVPTEDGTELAYAIYFTKYGNKLPEGAIPLYLEAQEPVMPWICPNFMLPPRSEEVLVYPMPNNVAHTAFHDGECWRVTEYENNYGYSLVALPDGYIKGWMPLPPAPEGDKP